MQARNENMPTALYLLYYVSGCFSCGVLLFNRKLTGDIVERSVQNIDAVEFERVRLILLRAEN